MGRSGKFQRVDGLTSLSSGLGREVIFQILPIGLIVPFLFLGIGIVTLWLAGRRKSSPMTVPAVCAAALGLVIGLGSFLPSGSGTFMLDAVVRALAAAVRVLLRSPL